MDEKLEKKGAKGGFLNQLLGHKKALYVILILGVRLLLFGSFFSGGSKQEEKKAETGAAAQENYEAVLEEKLTRILSSIKGAGEVSVVVTLENDGRVLPVRNVTDGQSQKENTALVVSEGSGRQQMAVTEEVKPKVRGVVVTCPGGGDVGIKADILEAVSALTGAAPHNIAVFEQKAQSK